MDKTLQGNLILEQSVRVIAVWLQKVPNADWCVIQKAYWLEEKIELLTRRGLEPEEGLGLITLYLNSPLSLQTLYYSNVVLFRVHVNAHLSRSIIHFARSWISTFIFIKFFMLNGLYEKFELFQWLMGCIAIDKFLQEFLQNFKLM